MAGPDLNLLRALDALLAEGSVVRAARRVGLSPSAMSRTLTRLRAITRDPLLVRAGRGLVLTPRAAELRDRVRLVTDEATAVLRPGGMKMDIGSLERTFTIRANEGFVEAFGARLIAAVANAAPRVRLRFAPKPDKDVRPLREGVVDLEVGVIGETGPEVRAQTLFRDRFVGAVRRGHALLSGEITAERYAACHHVVASRRGHGAGPVDRALAALGLAREVVAVVPSFSTALAVAAGSDLVALVPQSFMASHSRASRSLCTIESFELPVRTSELTVSQIWHPRMDADQGHRWLRRVVLEASGNRELEARRPSPDVTAIDGYRELRTPHEPRRHPRRSRGKSLTPTRSCRAACWCSRRRRG